MKFVSLATALYGASALASPMLQAREAPPSGSIKIRSLTYGGSGCNQGSLSPKISGDGSRLYLDTEYTAAQGPGISVDQSRKNCQINVGLDFPDGWKVAIAQADFAGYVKLDANVKAFHNVNHYFSGETDQVSVSSTFTGPVSKEFDIHDKIAISAGSWSKCDPAKVLFNINTSIGLTGDGNGKITVDASRYGFSIALNWSKC